jgi:outer membrane receptor protein involved in Fe transport
MFRAGPNLRSREGTARPGHPASITRKEDVMSRDPRLALQARLALAASLACSAVPTQAQDPAVPSLEAPTVEVVGTTPVPGLATPIGEVPSNVQVVTEEALRDKQAINLPDFMQQGIPSVFLSNVQNNPYQPNLTYRGFLSSPLLGAPQGLSVFQDGVRINEPFGDVVNYDLIPQNAISTMTLIPGSNPLFGLNTLGGAIEIRTKSGAYYPGLDAQVSGGSWGRIQGDFAWGDYSERTDYFISGSWFEEDGWRDFSPTEVGQLFGKVGWETSDTDFDLSITHGNTDLTGNGVLPKSMLEQRREQIYTYPDNTRNNMTMVALNGSHWLNSQWLLSGLTYFRGNTTNTLNGDVNDDFAAAGDPEGVLNRTRTEQNSYGLGLQGSWVLERNTLSIGATYDGSRSDFIQSEQEGDTFNPDRSVGQLDVEELENSLLGRTETVGLYFTDTFRLTNALAATLSGRFNHTTVEAEDRVNPGVPNNLDANYTYTKFNPAIGLTYEISPSLSTYGGWSQGNRAPTPIELGCADPNNPCSLPNAMAADPFLEQVVSQTIEAGFRGALFDDVRWNAGVFHSVNKDDILFVAAGVGSQGYFTNFGKTQRQGAEIGLSGGSGGRFNWSVDYSFVDATFESSACIVSESNSSAGIGCPDPDSILVSPGNKIPGIPEHQLRLSGDVRITDGWWLGATLLAFSEQYVHGNENNQHDTDGKVDGYQVLNLTTRYRVGSQWELFARVDNVFDKEYSSGGILAENSFDANGNFLADPNNWQDETFYAPGAPRAYWVGVRFQLEKAPRK